MTRAIPYVSVVIPVFNSEATIATVFSRTRDHLESLKKTYEIILVNDGSTDDSWRIMRDQLSLNRFVNCILLDSNYGQQNALLCGIRHAKGEFILMLDDDLQNAPEEISLLLDKAESGYDLVVGVSSVRYTSLVRRTLSNLFRLYCRLIFNLPPGFYLGNYKCISRPLAARISRIRHSNPSITSLALRYSCRAANVNVSHAHRRHGKSKYTVRKLVSLSISICVSYSKLPVWVLTSACLSLSFVYILIALIVVFKSVFVGIPVPGWASLMLLISISNALLCLILSLLLSMAWKTYNLSAGVPEYSELEVLRGPAE